MIRRRATVKKVIFLLLAIAFLVLPGCTDNPGEIEQTLPLGVYVMESSDDLKPYVVLKENNEFSFTDSIYSSYLAIGTYEEDDGSLILRTIGDDFEYRFQIKDKELIFNAEESTRNPSNKNIPDGSVFRFNEDYLAGREPLVGLYYDAEYKDDIFPNMTDLEIEEVIAKISLAAKERAKEGEKFKVTEEELKELGITGLDPQYLDKIEISTE